MIGLIHEQMVIYGVDGVFIAGAVMGFLRLTAEALLLGESKMSNKWGLVFKILAKVIAYFGAGKPKKL